MNAKAYRQSYSGSLSQVKTFVNFAVSGQFTKVLTTTIFIEYGCIIINGHVIILDNDDIVGIMDVAFLCSQGSNCPTAASQTTTYM